MRGVWSAVSVLIAMLACTTMARPQCKVSTNCRVKENFDSYNHKEFYFSVKGTTENKEQQVIITYDESGNNNYILLWCNSHEDEIGYKLAVNDPSLPVMSPPVSVKTVEVRGCTVPTNGSYYEALAALNITFLYEGNNNILWLTQLPATPQLGGHHLHELPINDLLITANDSKNPTRPKFDFLDNLTNLKNLELKQGIVLEKESIERLPLTLEMLTLKNTQMPAAESGLGNGSFWLERLHSLHYLYIWEDSRRVVGSLLPPPFASLPYLTMAKLTVPLAASPENTQWLIGSKLQVLELTSCRLVNLPVNLFKGANLTKLWLNKNNLASLPEGLFSSLKWLTDLNLSDNKLDGETLKRIISPLNRLKTLSVNRNPLGSLCGNATGIQGIEESNIPISLRRLEIKKTGAKRICDDWIKNDALMYINLDENDISSLRYSELMMSRREVKESVEIHLRNNPLRKISVTEKDYDQCLQASTYTEAGSHKPARVVLSVSALACDCDAYWLRKTLHSCSLLKMSRVLCEPESPPNEPQTLHGYDPHSISCRYEGGCPTGCNCKKRAYDNATVMRCEDILPPKQQWPPAGPDRPLALHVPPHSLIAVPRLALVELHAPNNYITHLGDMDIPSTLRVLDLANNNITHITAGAADKLRLLRDRPGYRVSLAGNRLACACEDEKAISILKLANIMDWNETLCQDGTYVFGKTKIDMCDSKFLLPLLIVFGTLLILTLVIVFIRYRLPYIRQFLFDHNMCLKWVLGVTDDVDDPMKTHDVFISYSYNDYEYAKKLIEKLEARGHSTIEHCRDWLPGTPVSQQITHSVMSARRTLLLVSDNYANSKWGLEEFHAAHAHAMEHGSARVIVVRCKLLAPQELPLELQLYLYNNTYLDWSDRYFWDKLWRVMPTPHAVPMPAIALLHGQEVPPSVQIQNALRATTVPALRLLEDKEPPLSELVLVAPGSAAASHAEDVQHVPSGHTSPVTSSFRVMPVVSSQKSRLPRNIHREMLTAPVRSTAVSPCAC